MFLSDRIINEYPSSIAFKDSLQILSKAFVSPSFPRPFLYVMSMVFDLYPLVFIDLIFSSS